MPPPGAPVTANAVTGCDLALPISATYIATQSPDSIPPDFDNDGDVDADDVNAIDACASGPTVALAAGCEDKDLDNDNDIDQLDFAIVQRCISGEGVCPDPQCME